MLTCFDLTSTPSQTLPSAAGETYLSMIMVALWNRAGHYIFALWFLLVLSSLLFFSPNLSRRRLDVCHTSTHGVALARI